MKELFDWLVYVCISIVIVAFIAKLVLWFQLKSNRRIGIIKSYMKWFTIHELHNTQSRSSKTFKKWNNVINNVFWACIVILIISYVGSSNGSIDTAPNQFQKKQVTKPSK